MTMDLENETCVFPFFGIMIKPIIGIMAAFPKGKGKAEVYMHVGG